MNWRPVSIVMGVGTSGETLGVTLEIEGKGELLRLREMVAY